MKKYTFTILVALLAVFAVSCQKTTEGVTKVGSYFQTLGANSMYLGVGEEFTDPGYTELEGGGTVSTVIYDMNGEEVDAVSTDAPGFFEIVYSTTNDQGFYFQKSRMVYVYDSTVTETLGKFDVDTEASYSYNNGKSFDECVAGWQDNPTQAYHPYSTTMVTITFTQVAGNIYTCNDLMGGWYDSIQGRGLYYLDAGGPSYAGYFMMSAYVTLNADMTLTLMSSNIPCWSDGLDYIANSAYDPETGRLVYDWMYASQIACHIEMVKK